MITQEEFERKINRFPEFEFTRGSLENSFTTLINKGLEIEAYLLLLATWNFAGFRYVLKNFDLKKFKEAIKEINPMFDKLKEKRFEDADFDKLKEDISFIYSKLRDLVKQTGATKIMYFKNPNLFIMWDTGIRKLYKIPQNHTTAEDYINFLKLMQKEFSNLKCENQNRSFAKAIDEYNFVVTQERIREKKDAK